jgi:hypothetical protein
MTILIDDTLATAFLTMPVREGWVEDAGGIAIRAGLSAGDVTPDDIALLPLPEATLLTRTHVIDRSVAIVHDGAGMVAMRTPVRPDEIERVPVYLRDVGAAGEALTRALLRPYFGIEATELVREGDPPADAAVVVSEGAAALRPDEAGFREDLARSWFIMTGKAYVSHVTVVGVAALARDPDDGIARLRAAIDAGWERRRDVRLAIRETLGVDPGLLAEATGKMRFSLEPDDQEPARLLAERGTWGTDFGRTLPAYRDQLPTS